MTSVRPSTRCRFARSHSKSAERVITFHVSRETYLLRLPGHVRHTCITGTSPGLADRQVDLFAFGRCDDEHSQAQRWVGVRLPDTAGCGVDGTEKGHVGLASYYTERGETPGAWIGLAWRTSTASTEGIR